MFGRDHTDRKAQRRRRLIDQAGARYFEEIHATGRHIERFPHLGNADFRAWLDLSGTGRDLGNEVGEAAAELAEDCLDCGERDENGMSINRRDAAQRAVGAAWDAAARAAHEALTQRIVRELNEHK